MSKGTVLLLCVLVLLPSTLYCQESDSEPQEGAATDSSAAGVSTEEPDRFKLAAIPMINYDPAFEWNLAALANCFFAGSTADTVSPLSMAGAVLGYTTDGSWYWFLYSKLYLDEDNYRATAAYGDASVNFQYYEELAGSFIDYNSTNDVFLLELQRRVYQRWYLGLKYLSLKTTTTFDVESPPDDVSKQNMNNLGFVVSHDARDSIYNPHSGDFMNLKTAHYRDTWGSDYTFDAYELDLTKFFPINERQVVAARCAAFVATGDVPFEGQYVVQQDDIRGYTDGKHRAEQIYDLQGEFRWNVHGKWGLVAFGGVATAVNDPEEITWGGLLPAAGAGVRYTVIPSEEINIGIDLAFGRDDWGIYFRIGEAFGGGY